MDNSGTTYPQFCFCGRKIQYKWGIPVCPTHKEECFNPPKERKRIKKWSGTTKRYKGRYEDF